MSGIYNVNKISINGNVINGVDVTNLGISPQHVPSSFAVKKEIAKISEDIDKKIQEELEIYRISELKKGTTEVPFNDVNGYDGISIRLIADDDDIEDMVAAGIPAGDLEENKSYIPTGLTVSKYTVDKTTHNYLASTATSYIDDKTTHRGWEVLIDCTKYKKVSDVYKVPRKIFLKDIDMSKLFRVIKITFKDDDETSFADKIHLKSIYAPDVVTFGSTRTSALTESSLDGIDEVATNDSLHSRIDITTRFFEGQFYPVANQDIVLHNQSYCDFTNVVAMSVSGTVAPYTLTAGYIKNVICPDTFRAVITNVHKGIKHITLPINDLSVGYKSTVGANTVYGFTPLFVDDHVKTNPQCVVEIPSGCKLSYRIEHLHKFESGEDEGKITSNCIKTECFECNYFDAAWPDVNMKIVYPTDRFRMISENEYFMNEFMGLKNTLLFDCLEKKDSESFDKLGHVNLTLKGADKTFTYNAYNTTYELTRSTIYLTNMLKTETEFYYLEKQQPLGFDKFYPEFEHLTRQDAEAVFCIVNKTDTTSYKPPKTISDYYSDAYIVKVMLSNYKNTPDSGTTVVGHDYAVYIVDNDSGTAIKDVVYSSEAVIHEYEPLDSEHHQFVCPKLNYTSELSDIIDYTQVIGKQNQNMVLTTTDADIATTTFTLKCISNLAENDRIAYKQNGNWMLSDAISGTPTIESIATILKNVFTDSSVQYVYVRSKAEASTAQTYDGTNTLFYVDSNATDLSFNNVVISEKINNQVVSIASSDATLIYYPDLRSFQHVNGNATATTLIVNSDILQLINPVFTVIDPTAAKYVNLYLTPNALRGVMEYVRPSETTYDTPHKFDLSTIATNVYLPTGYKGNAKVSDVLKLPETTNVFEYDPAILM